MGRLALAALALALFGCPARTEAPAAASAWDVYKGNTLVLSVTDGPGTLVSTALREPGTASPAHPFLGATARDAGTEDALKRLLDEAKDTQDFLSRLKRAGYSVKPAVH